MRLFKHVILYTDKLNEMKNFYTNILGLSVIMSYDNCFTIQVGSSSLSFKQSTLHATYHFAFNIPGNKVKDAKQWLLGRVELNREDGNDEIYYPSFDADAIYFEDPAGNIVEFIGRRNRNDAAKFTASSLIDISEMSITTPFVSETAKRLNEFGIHSRNQNPIKPDSLNFLGEGDTFIILVPPYRRWYFSEKISETFPLEIELDNLRKITVDSKGIIIS